MIVGGEVQTGGGGNRNAENNGSGGTKSGK